MIVLLKDQHMLMRVAITIHNNNMEKVKETYELMSNKYYSCNYNYLMMNT